MALARARRIALAAQGFTDPRPRGRVDARHVRRVLARVKLLQIDSVNVLTRAHYLPLYSRLGAYPPALLDDLAYRRRELFEYWGHEASLIPVEHYPLLRHRMDTIRMWAQIRRMAEEAPGYVEKVEAEIAERGPIAASELSDGGERSGNWWGWAKGKTACEWLFARGRVAVADRRNFTRLYDLPSRVLPPAVLAAPAVERHEAWRALVLEAAGALGVATAGQLLDYYRLPVAARAVVAELEAAGELEAVQVPGWSQQAYLDPAARCPRHVGARALLAPFDPVVWERGRAEALFGFRYRIEIYVPAHQRVHGYYVLPFLLDDALVARVDCKSDRGRGRLLVRAAWIEDGHDPVRVARELAAELSVMAAWLGLGDVEVERRGDLADDLRRIV
jgi:hypothetical protein